MRAWEWGQIVMHSSGVLNNFNHNIHNLNLNSTCPSIAVYYMTVTSNLNWLLDLLMFLSNSKLYINWSIGKLKCSCQIANSIDGSTDWWMDRWMDWSIDWLMDCTCTWVLWGHVSGGSLAAVGWLWSLRVVGWRRRGDTLHCPSNTAAEINEGLAKDWLSMDYQSLTCTTCWALVSFSTSWVTAEQHAGEGRGRRCTNIVHTGR